MNYTLDFKSEEPLPSLKTKTKAYFQNHGFKLSEEAPNNLQFKAGSTLRNMIAINPLKWKSQIEIEFNDQNIVAHFEINTIHQIVTQKETKVWETFVNNYQNTIETGTSFFSENENEIKEAKNANWELIGQMFFGAILLGIPGGLIATITGFEVVFFTCLFVGAAIFLVKEIF
ncbi:hypothetical protein [Aureispira anguillae]|uniref:Uncharacterized protein n=1 Tax=Aureispira anguillae TaxID=2864201 RepID=A0A915YE19_9BACT|nr:hypothetical protein [Aureispira anguillae]BDS11393.1 hypothetical protein AsAng_0021070 [Aureispira anguillae]